MYTRFQPIVSCFYPSHTRTGTDRTLLVVTRFGKQSIQSALSPLETFVSSGELLFVSMKQSDLHTSPFNSAVQAGLGPLLRGDKTGAWHSPVKKCETVSNNAEIEVQQGGSMRRLWHFTADFKDAPSTLGL